MTPLSLPIIWALGACHKPEPEPDLTCHPETDSDCTVTLIPANEPGVWGKFFDELFVSPDKISTDHIQRYEGLCPDGYTAEHYDLAEEYEYLLPDGVTDAYTAATSAAFDVDLVGQPHLPYSSYPTLFCEGEDYIYSPTEDDFLSFDPELAAAKETMNDTFEEDIAWENPYGPTVFALGDTEVGAIYLGQENIGVLNYNLLSGQTDIVFDEPISTQDDDTDVTAAHDGVHILLDGARYLYFNPTTRENSAVIDWPSSLDLTGLTTVEGIPFADLNDVDISYSNPVADGNSLWLSAQPSVSYSEAAGVASQNGPATLFEYDLTNGQLQREIPIDMPVQALLDVFLQRRTLSKIEGTDYLVALGITDPLITHDKTYVDYDFVAGYSTVKVTDTVSETVISTQRFPFVDTDDNDEEYGVRISDDGLKLAFNGEIYEFNGTEYEPLDTDYLTADVEEYEYYWKEEATPQLHEYESTQLYPNYLPLVTLDGDTILRDEARINDRDEGVEVYVGHHRDYIVVDKNEGTAYSFGIFPEGDCYRFFSGYGWETSCLLEVAGPDYAGYNYNRTATIYDGALFFAYGPDVYRIELE